MDTSVELDVQGAWMLASRRRLQEELRTRRLAVLRLRVEQLTALIDLLSTSELHAQPGVKPTRRLLALCCANVRLCIGSASVDELEQADSRAAEVAHLAKRLLHSLQAAPPASGEFVLSHSHTVLELCAVCHEHLLPGQSARSPPCAVHVFHSDCLIEWLKHGSSCPVCRAPARLPAECAPTLQSTSFTDAAATEETRHAR